MSFGWNIKTLKRQLQNQQGLARIIVNIAKQQGLAPAFALAIASRETGIRNILGDGGHGVGVMQIDVRYHEIAARAKADGSWLDHPSELIRYGVNLLIANFVWAKREWPDYTDDQRYKISAAAYNAGRGGAIQGVAAGDADRGTTGHDYGADVVARMKAFSTIMDAIL